MKPIRTCNAWAIIQSDGINISHLYKTEEIALEAEARWFSHAPSRIVEVEIRAIQEVKKR